MDDLTVYTEYSEYDEYIDTSRYPIAESNQKRAEVVTSAQSSIRADGCVVLKGFFRPERIADLVGECDRVEKFGHRNFTRTNPYFTADREDLPTSHPLRRFFDRSNAFVPADNFGADMMHLRNVGGPNEIFERHRHCGWCWHRHPIGLPSE
mgnify:CR=1 FL=1